jgi:hypothetical protein
MGHSSTTVTKRHYFRWLERGEKAELARLNEKRASFRPVAADGPKSQGAANPLGYSVGAAGLEPATSSPPD